MSDIVQRLRMIVASGNGGAFEEHIMEAAEEIERLREEHEWVPVAERLPEEGVKVLVSSHGRPHPEIGWREWVPGWPTGKLCWTLGEEFDRGFWPSWITHWTPCPAPPEAGR